MAAPSPGSGVTPTACDVVLLEDDALLRLTLGELLEEQGHRVRPAETGDEALAEVGAVRGACVLIADRGLGDPNGWQDGHEVAAEALKRWPDLRVVYISGAPDQTDRALSGRERRMLKPFDLDALLGLIRQLTGASGP